jgi:NAD(P)-dependent dehydrogenase (short-subunit alcohol dehydrogenase family)
VVTGAAMGIGRGIALLFAREGAKVAVVDYDRDGGKQTAAAIQAAGGTATFIEADVADPVAVQMMVAATKAAYGRIDILVNNAGIDLPQATNVVETTIEDWDRTLNVNLKGVFLCCKYAVPEMLERGGGTIINIASIAGLRPMSQEAAYGASKGGLTLLTRQMARDYAHHGIRVNSVCPGPMEKPTRHRQAYLEGDEVAIRKRQAFAEAMPLGRMCLPEDIAQAALFLASDEASMITGIELVVDGGFILG